MKKYLLVLFCALAASSIAVAQTKIYRSVDCDKAHQLYVTQIPDQEGSAYEISQNKCKFAKPFTIEGLEAKEFVNTSFNERMGTSVHATSVGVTYFANGDKLYQHSTSTMDQKAQTSSGNSTFISGTGRLLGIKGSVTFTCKGKGSESGAGYTCQGGGEYTLPAAKKSP
jgi:hypothetical protein